MTEKQRVRRIDGKFVAINDGLRSFTAGLGDPTRDKSAASSYYPSYLTDDQLLNAYDSTWVAAKLIDIPAKDACRKWRSWQGEQKQISALEGAEKKLSVRDKVLECFQTARLLGGCSIYIGTDQDSEKPIELEKIKKGGIKHLTLLNRTELTPGEIEQDPLAENYGNPKFYEIANSSKSTKIHYSHLVIMHGKKKLAPFYSIRSLDGWGSSVLQSTFDSIKNADSTAANIASLVFEANVDVFRIKDFISNLGDKDYERNIIERFQLAATSKSINKALIMDAEEEYARKQVNFQTLPDVMQQFLLMVSGAADIPLTRFLGQSAKGLNSDGSGDLKNYYDNIQSIQELELQVSMQVLDECLIRSATGSRPEELDYKWNPLMQMSEKEVAEIGKTTAETVKALIDTGLYTPEVLQEVTTNQLVQSNVFPGLDNLMKELSSDFGFNAGSQENNDAAPRTLYVHRSVKNASDIINWAKEQGFEKTLKPEDLHVKIAFSRQALDWMKIGEAWSSEMKVAEGGPRQMDKLGESAVVVLFKSSELEWRHESIVEAGASWDWPEYQPHITISHDAGEIDVDKITPYQGEIVLGPEIFEELDLDWKSNIKEQ